MRSIPQIETDIAAQEAQIEKCLSDERQATKKLELARQATLAARQQLGRLISELGKASADNPAAMQARNGHRCAGRLSKKA